MGKGYLSYTMALILQALDNGYRYGFDVMAVTGLRERDGLSGPSTPRRRRFRHFQMGAAGHRAAGAASGAKILRADTRRRPHSRRRASDSGCWSERN